MVRARSASRRPAASAYEVKLYNDSGDLVTHHVDDRFISNADGTPRYAQYGDRSAVGPELWVMLMEKAWAAQRGGFNNMDFGAASDGLRAVTGKSSTWHNVATENADQIIANISQAVTDGKPVVCNTPGDHHQPGARVGDRGRHLARQRPLLQRRGREQDRPHDRRPEPARAQPPARPGGRRLPDDLRVVRHPRRVGEMRLELHETGQSQVEGTWVSAANIWEREPLGRDGPAGLHAQITVEEEPPVDVAEGEELEFAGARWRVVKITEDPVHRRGGVILERIQA